MTEPLKSLIQEAGAALIRTSLSQGLNRERELVDDRGGILAPLIISFFEPGRTLGQQNLLHPVQQIEAAQRLVRMATDQQMFDLTDYVAEATERMLKTLQAVVHATETQH